ILDRVYENVRRDGADIESSQVVIATQVKALIRRRYSPLPAADEASLNVHSKPVLPVQGLPSGKSHNGADEAYIAANSRNLRAYDQAFSPGGADRTVNRAESVAGSDGAGDNAVERVGPGDAAEIDGLEKCLGSIAEHRQAGVIQSVADADALKGAQQITGRGGKSGAGLAEVLQLVQDVLRQVQLLAAGNGHLLGLVEVKPAVVHGESELDGTVFEIRLGEAELKIALPAADIAFKAQSFAQAQKIVGLVVEADERTGKTAYAARKSNAVLSLLLDLDHQVDRSILVVDLALGIVFGLQRLKIIELVEPQDTQVP